MPEQFIVVERLSFSNTTIKMIENTSYEGLKQRIIEGLNLCEDEHDTVKTLKAGINLLKKKQELEEGDILLKSITG